MKIKSISTWVADLDNTRPYTIAFKTTTEVRNAFVEITLENGMTGIGSGFPSKYVVGESLEDTIAVLNENYYGFLIGRDIRETPALLWEVFHKYAKNPAARAAFDIALHDAFTKYLDIPLHKYLGRVIKSMPTSVTIGIKNVQETVEEATEYYDNGYRVLKVKLGLDVEEDIERLVKIREKYGNEVVIRIDANQGYDLNTAVDFYNRTQSLNIELNEQPIPAGEVAQMKSLPWEIRKTIAADESLISAKDAIHLVEGEKACGIFNIKLMKCGGIFQGQRIGSIALASDIDLMWGCNDESIVSITAGLNVAFSFPNTKYIDLDGSLDLAKDVVKGGFNIKDGIMTPSDKPGLGVERIR